MRSHGSSEYSKPSTCAGVRHGVETVSCSLYAESWACRFSVGLWGSSPQHQHRQTSSLIRDTTLPEPAAVAWARRMSSAASTTGTPTTASLAAAARAAVSSDALLLPPRDCHLAVPVC